jgi:hypothetical protein
MEVRLSEPVIKEVPVEVVSFVPLLPSQQEIIMGLREETVVDSLQLLDLMVHLVVLIDIMAEVVVAEPDNQELVQVAAQDLAVEDQVVLIVLPEVVELLIQEAVVVELHKQPMDQLVVQV